MAQLKKKISDFASKGSFVFAKWNNIIDVKMCWKIVVFEYFITKLFGRFYLSVLLGIVKLCGRLYYLAILFIQRGPSQQGMWLFLATNSCPAFKQMGVSALKANGHLFLDDCICPVRTKAARLVTFLATNYKGVMYIHSNTFSVFK